jgi:hypothetical protein
MLFDEDMESSKSAPTKPWSWSSQDPPEEDLMYFSEFLECTQLSALESTSSSFKDASEEDLISFSKGLASDISTFASSSDYTADCSNNECEEDLLSFSDEDRVPCRFFSKRNRWYSQESYPWNYEEESVPSSGYRSSSRSASSRRTGEPQVRLSSQNMRSSRNSKNRTQRLRGQKTGGHRTARSYENPPARSNTKSTGRRPRKTCRNARHEQALAEQSNIKEAVLACMIRGDT